jgi:hypothetical protein
MRSDVVVNLRVFQSCIKDAFTISPAMQTALFTAVLLE